MSRASADVDAFVEAQGPALLRLAYVLTRDRSSAEDLAQTALLQVCRRWRRVTAADDPTAYARRILVNAHLDAQRRRSSTERPTDPMALVVMSEGEADPMSIVDDRDQLRVALSLLRPRSRTVLVLRYYVGLDDAAIGDALGVGQGAVRSIASRALAQLREQFRPSSRAEKEAT